MINPQWIMPNDLSFPQHETPEILNESLRVARRCAVRGDPLGKLAAALLLVNHADYLAKHLLFVLEKYVQLASYVTSRGIIFKPQNVKRSKKALGEVIGALSLYSFPDREDILSLLKQFNTLRIELVHNLLLSSVNEQETGQKVESLMMVFDQLIFRWNTIQRAIKSIWPVPPPPPQEENLPQQEEPPISPLPVVEE